MYSLLIEAKGEKIVNKKLLALLFSFLVIGYYLLFTVSFVQAQWSGIGPGGGGGMHNSAISPVNSSIMAVSCDMGGYYVTSNGGTTWKMINLYGMPTQTAFDPSNENKFYCCADLVYRTTDKGVTWAPFTDSADQGGAGNYPLALIIDPENTNYMFLINGTKEVQYENSIENAVYSTDGGSTWNAVTGFGGGEFVKNVFIDKDGSSSTRNIYVATDGGFYKSTNNNGSAFAEAETGLPNPYIYDFDGGSNGGTTILYVTLEIDDDMYMYKSTNGASSWSAVTIAGVSPYDVKVPINYPNTVYIMSGEDEIYKSVNGGTSWTPVMEGDGANVTNDWQKSTASFGFRWADIINRYHCISVCGSNANVVLWTDDGRLVRSDNGGTSWTGRFTTDKGSGYWSTTGLDVTTTYKIVFDGNNPQVMYLSETDIGLWKSVNGGDSWIYLNTGYHNTYGLAIDPSNSNKLWLACGSIHDLPETKVLATAPNGTGVIRYSINGGTTWASATGLPGRIITDVAIDPGSPAGNRILYATSFGNGVYKSVDDGHSWTAINSGISGSMNAWKIERGLDGSLYLVVMHNSGGTDGVLYKSTNGGASWTAIKTAAQALDYILDVAVNPTDPNIIFVCGYNRDRPGGVYKTTNGGGAWTRVLSVGHVYGLTLDPREPNTVYAGMCNDDDFPQATETGFYKTTDAGASWLRISTITFRACREVFLDPANINKMYVTTFGGGFLTNTAGSPDTVPPTGTISINSGAAATPTTAVTLTLSASDASGVSQMKFSNDNTTWSTAESYATTKNWTLTSGNGLKTVYAKYKDNAGNWSTAAITDTITLTDVFINGGPYVSCVTSTSIVIAWQTKIQMYSNSVQYGLTAGYGNTKTAPAGYAIYDNQYMQYTKIEGLQPGTIYHYRTITDSLNSGDYVFKTYPPPGSPTIKIGRASCRERV